ncbi:hypothetical protein EKO04_002046 [Ascochyta lentis]|uniref:ribonuclease T1 n=1 Tax=Ascochyta lentis TaxID=205686 RepID=A0A8H7JC82_9PLEO|nr:hypothetical protein EKO04_002046 [Ascochyta lentis]
MHLLTLLPLLAPALALPTSLTPSTPQQPSTPANPATSNAATPATPAPNSTYPHKYNNYEGFDFLVGGTYFEFPLKTSGVYTGGSPGADRVVVNGSGARAGEITHTGASGNNFVACSGW